MSGPTFVRGESPRLTCPRCGNRRVLIAYRRDRTGLHTREAAMESTAIGYYAACRPCLKDMGKLYERDRQRVEEPV